MNLLRMVRSARVRLAAFTALGLGVAVAQAAPIERKLGDGLLYVRVHAVPEDLPTSGMDGSRACILDLRYATSTPAGATVLGSWLKFHSSDHGAVLVLINGRTAPGLLEVMHHETLPGLLSVGVTSQAFAPDLMVRQSAHEERRAYEAFEHGTDIATLTTDYPDKQRNDEASLAHGGTDEGVPGDDDGAVIPDAPAAKDAPPSDAALERAIHLYQGLRAMKRL